MKHYIYLFCLVGLLAGCSQLQIDDSVGFTDSNSITQTKAEYIDKEGYVSEEDAYTYITEVRGIPQSKIKESVTVDFESGESIYIFNFVNEEGWIICPSTIDACPVIAESDYGNFDEADDQWRERSRLIQCIDEYLTASKKDEFGERNINRMLWRRVVKEKHPQTKSDPDTSEVDIFYRTDTLSNVQYGPYTQTRWDQNTPFNTASPRAADPVIERCQSGCANVALAQLAYYTHYAANVPLSMFESASCSDYYYAGPPYNFTFSNYSQTSWAKMARWLYDDYSGRTYSATAALISYISSITNTQYDGTGGTTSSSNLSAAARALGLNGSNFTTYSEDSVKGELQSQRPVITAGVNGTTGHTYIIDGYHYLWIRETETVCDLSGEILSESHFDTTILQWHYNAGERVDNYVFWANPNVYYTNGRLIMTGWSI